MKKGLFVFVMVAAIVVMVSSSAFAASHEVRPSSVIKVMTVSK